MNDEMTRDTNDYGRFKLALQMFVEAADKLVRAARMANPYLVSSFFRGNEPGALIPFLSTHCTVRIGGGPLGGSPWIESRATGADVIVSNLEPQGSDKYTRFRCKAGELVYPHWAPQCIYVDDASLHYGSHNLIDVYSTFGRNPQQLFILVG